jgi:hypothetical protein
MRDGLVDTIGLVRGHKVSVEQIRAVFDFLRKLPAYYEIAELPEWEAASIWQWAQGESRKRRAEGKSAQQLYGETFQRDLQKRKEEEIPSAETDDSELAKIVYAWTVMHSKFIRQALDQLETVLGKTVGYVYDGMSITLPVDARFWNLQPGGTTTTVAVRVNYLRTVWGGPEDKPKRLISASVEEEKKHGDEGSVPFLLDLEFALKWAIANMDPDPTPASK